MTSEDPNIAMLRDDARYIADAYPGTSNLMLQAIDALASTLAEAKTIAATAEAWERNVEHLTAKYEELEAALAERDRRIAARDKWIEDLETRLALRSAEADEMATELEALKAPPAPAPGELAEALSTVRLRPDVHEAGFAGAGVDRLRVVIAAAESWQRLQWRPASEAPKSTDLLLLIETAGTQRGVRAADGRWFDDYGEEYAQERILGFIPLDALPALNGGDDNG